MKAGGERMVGQEVGLTWRVIEEAYLARICACSSFPDPILSNGDTVTLQMIWVMEVEARSSKHDQLARYR